MICKFTREVCFRCISSLRVLVSCTSIILSRPATRIVLYDQYCATSLQLLGVPGYFELVEYTLDSAFRGTSSVI